MSVVKSFNKKTNTIEQVTEALKKHAILEKLLKIKAYFEENKENFSRIGKNAIKNPWRANTEIKEINKKLDEANQILDELINTEIRFHPVLFEKAIKTINEILNKLRTNPEIDRLHSWAGTFKRSKNNLGVIKWMGGIKVDTDAVIALSSTIKELQVRLVKARKKILELSDGSIEGYSNNFVINHYIEQKMGPRQPK